MVSLTSRFCYPCGIRLHVSLHPLKGRALRPRQRKEGRKDRHERMLFALLHHFLDEALLSVDIDEGNDNALVEE